MRLLSFLWFLLAACRAPARTEVISNKAIPRSGFLTLERNIDATVGVRLKSRDFGGGEVHYMAYGLVVAPSYVLTSDQASGFGTLTGEADIVPRDVVGLVGSLGPPGAPARLVGRIGPLALFKSATPLPNPSVVLAERDARIGERLYHLQLEYARIQAVRGKRVARNPHDTPELFEYGAIKTDFEWVLSGNGIYDERHALVGIKAEWNVLPMSVIKKFLQRHGVPYLSE